MAMAMVQIGFHWCLKPAYRAVKLGDTNNMFGDVVDLLICVELISVRGRLVNRLVKPRIVA